MQDNDRSTADATSAGGETATWSAPSTPLESGQRVGNYVIREALGEGGFAVVYSAQQIEPVRREVAIKIIKPGMDTRQVLVRFQAERQALAMMDHPHVAKVFDAGVMDTGRPYFVMEYVPGTPITEYCSRQRYDARDRLGLFRQVCDAVQHAHQKGIVHRDISPSNVLVALKGTEPQCKVIDFGVAKAINQQLTRHTIWTEQGQMIGKPEYMAPEQAEMTAEDIDTRCDIYSLGVLLYELLTGVLPFDRKTLHRASLGEIQRMIREIDPPKPSTRPPERSRQRELAGDLDWITMKAMEKDRARRYQTANALAMDITRHLNNEPVLAGPPGTTYRLRKFVHRNRSAVLAGLLVSAALVAGVVGTTIGLLRAEAEARRAVSEKGIADAVNQFLNEDLLSAVDPTVQGRKVSVREVLDAAARKIEGKFVGQPLVEASIRTTLGNTYRNLGEYELAEPHLAVALTLRRMELGPQHPETLRSLHDKALLHSSQGRFDVAEPMMKSTLEARRQVLGEDHPDTLTSMNDLAELYRTQERMAEARPLYERTLELRRRVLGQDDPDTAATMNDLALLYMTLGELDEAQPLLLRSLEIHQSVLGRDHPDTLSAVNNLAYSYLMQQRYEEAEPLLVETLARRREVLGGEHQLTLQSLHNLANAYTRMGRYAEAEPLYAEAVEQLSRTMGAEFFGTGIADAGYGACLLALHRHDDAEPVLLEAYRILDAALGPTAPRTAGVATSLAELYEAWGRPAEAARWRDRVPAPQDE